MLKRLEDEGLFAALQPGSGGFLRINVPFAGKFDERPQLVRFLRRVVLDRRQDIKEIQLFVTDVKDFYGSPRPESGDPQILINYAVQDGRTPLPPAELVMGMHPDCSSAFLTSFWGYYQHYYYMWQDIVKEALKSAPVAVSAHLWLEEAI